MAETKMAETKMAETLLDVDGIETCYGLSQVLFGLSLQIKSGEMVALMGRNGMGKTTTIRSIMGLTPGALGRNPLRRGAGSWPAVLQNRKARHRPGARGPPDLSEPHRATKISSPPPAIVSAVPIPGPSKRSTRCFRGLPSAAATWA